jgi:nuclear transport factor 2 (NTF2) superfamily protein
MSALPSKGDVGTKPRHVRFAISGLNSNEIEHGLMRLRIASINDLPIKENERKYHWPLGRRPDDHPSLSDLGL